MREVSQVINGKRVIGHPLFKGFVEAAIEYKNK